MLPRGLSQNALARALNVPPRRINEIVLEKRGITADTALRLARFFGTSAEMWTGLQADYDLWLAGFIERYEEHNSRLFYQWPKPAISAVKKSLPSVKMNKTDRRRTFITRKKNFLAQAQEGNRGAIAYFVCWMMAQDKAWWKENGPHFIPVLANHVIVAWKNCDAKFFDDISRTIKRGTDQIHADPRRVELVDNWLRIHCRDKKKKYTLSEIIQICGLSKDDKKSASILREDFDQWRKTRRSNTIMFL